MIPKEEAKKEVKKLVDLYEKYKASGDIKNFEGKEQNTKTTFILPLFKALDWDVHNEKNVEVVSEERVLKGAVDYAFRISGQNKFFVEAKPIGSELKEHTKQAIEYGVNSGNAWVVLTNFESIIVFNCEWKEKDWWKNALFGQLEYKDYLNNFDLLWLLSKESITDGKLDEWATRVGKKVPRTPIDKELLSKFLDWRLKLSKDISNKHKYPTEEIDEFVQKLLIRLLFIKNCEDRGFETSYKLLPVIQTYKTHKKGVLKLLRRVFDYCDETYDSSIFENGEIDKINFDESLLSEILNGLYFTSDGLRYNFNIIPADVMGNLYEQYLGHILKKTPQRAKLKEGKTHRKEQGIYYTPTYIVDYIVRNTLGELLKGKKVNASKIRVLDPACGSGSFLVKAFDVLNEHYSKDKMYGQKTLTGYSTKERILKDNIFGVDLDKQAVEIAQLNLLLRIAEKGQKLPLLKENVKIGNSLIDDPTVAGDKAFKWEEKFANIMKDGGFDIVIGNPPYFNIKSDDPLKNSRNFKLLSQGVVNAASLFLKKGLDLLKDDGCLGFIIPKSFLIVDSWKPIRDIVLENSLVCVRDVSMAFEEVGLEQVIIIVKKKKSRDNKVKILKGDKEINVIPQSFFQKRGIILTSLDQEKFIIIEKIEKDSINLGEVADMPRGITVKSSDYLDTPSKEGIHVLGGTNLERYGIKQGGKRKPNRYLDKNDVAIQQKKSVFSCGRIIYQNIASSVPKIVASIELNGLPTDDTLNNLLISDSSLTNEYILAILNSSLVTFYLRYAIINCSSLTIHLDKPYLGKIPIKKISKNEQQVITKLVDKMLSLNKRLNELGDKKTDERARIEEEIRKTDAEIDELVYKIYGITEKEKKVIEESLK